MHEVQILQVPHARRDLRRHVDETVETETRKRHESRGRAKLRARAARAAAFREGDGGGRDREELAGTREDLVTARRRRVAHD